MSNTTQLFIGLRRENGQIGYLSESLTIPEFFEFAGFFIANRYSKPAFKHYQLLGQAARLGKPAKQRSFAHASGGIPQFYQ